MERSSSLPPVLPTVLRETAGWCRAQSPDRTEQEYETIAWRRLMAEQERGIALDDAVANVRRSMQEEFRATDTPIVR